MNENGRLQNLRDFTVQICNANNEIVGTGIAVSPTGQIVTCRHVVEAAGIDLQASTNVEIVIYFPQASDGEGKRRRAVVTKFFPDNDDDVVLLQLTDGSPPLAPEQIAVLGTSEKSNGNPFRSYGYRPMPPYIGGWADGTIMGCVDRPPSRKLQVEPIQLNSKQIAPGMSGSGVLDVARNLLVGIISETYFPPSDDPKDRDTAWAVNVRVLSIPPFDLKIQDSDYPLRAAPEPRFEGTQTEEDVSINKKYSWNNAPQVLPEWIGRKDLLGKITANWKNPNKHIVGLIGFGGEGKSSLARKWVDSVIAWNRAKDKEHSHTDEKISMNLDGSQKTISYSTKKIAPLDGIFWWGFNENRNISEFLEVALNYFGVNPERYPAFNKKAQVIGALLSTGHYLFVLDGLEVLQHQGGDEYGMLTSPDLRDFLTYFASPNSQSFCLVTSRAPMLDLVDYTAYNHHDVDRLSEKDGHDLLRKLGVKGSNSEIDKIVSIWDGHALTLSILAAYLVEHLQKEVKYPTDIPIPTADEPRYERIHHVLRSYDKYLNKTERQFLNLFSAFRTPVHEVAFEKVFIPLLQDLVECHI